MIPGIKPMFHPGLPEFKKKQNPCNFKEIKKYLYNIEQKTENGNTIVTPGINIYSVFPDLPKFQPKRNPSDSKKTKKTFV